MLEGQSPSASAERGCSDALDGWVNRGEGDWDTKTAPTRDEQDHLKPKRIGIMLTVARRMAQGMFPPALVFQRAIPDQIEDPIGGRRERPECGGGQALITAAASHWPDGSSAWWSNI